MRCKEASLLLEQGAEFATTRMPPLLTRPAMRDGAYPHLLARRLFGAHDTSNPHWTRGRGAEGRRGSSPAAAAAEPGAQAGTAVCGGGGLALPDDSPPAPPEGGFRCTALLLIFLTTLSTRALPLPSIRALPWRVRPPASAGERPWPLPPPRAFPIPCNMALRNAPQLSSSAQRRPPLKLTEQRVASKPTVS